MTQSMNQEDVTLVSNCLNGSRQAWDEFYVRFLPLVRRAVEKHTYRAAAEMDDFVQDVFISLHKDLKTYDPAYKLSQFVWIVAKRVCIDHYRKAKTSKRSGVTVPVDHHDGGTPGYHVLESFITLTDDEIGRSQEAELLKEAFRELGERCRELLRLRYLEELQFKEIAELLGANKKSLAVQAGRCIDKLRARYNAIERRRK